jgi:heme/copper-type cytochrome/quinol oxidase subunit 2
VSTLHVVAAVTAAALLGAMPEPQATPSVDVVAENWKFTPDHLVMHVGVRQTLHVVSRGGVHGIGSDVLGIAKTAIPPDEVTTIVVEPKKAGTYRIGCVIVCGPSHDSMQLIADVEP